MPKAQAVATAEQQAPEPEIVDVAEPNNQALAIVQVIDRAARDPNIDVDKMERLFALRERMLVLDAEQAFNEAMRTAQAEMPAVLRDAENPETHSSYSRIETVNKAIVPIITKHGFSLSFGTDNSHIGGHYRVVCQVSHIGGHSRDYHVDIPIDDVGPKGAKNKTMVHGFGSSMTYGRRYLTLLIFNVTMKDADNDGNTAGHAPITAEQKDELVALMKETGADTAKFLVYFRVKSLDVLPADRFSEAKAALEKKGKRT